MPTYIGLARYTPEGAKRVKERWAQGNPIDEASKAAKATGCEVKASYLTMPVRHGGHRRSARRRGDGQTGPGYGHARHVPYRDHARLDGKRI